eukprot:TRINITY_DN3274_c0_g1_i2.p1 TRINITY_DN3274_c0_g1~~TRINITY_DN3274_c0_g1_i2.p1  ORF type:complete len:746 (+),score=178.70 TRINITY_DN3274_c0_g1_i2:290-2239(+)
MYIVLDHTRTVMMVIEDGALPSNVGGGGNVRNVLRRVFAILHKNGWWEKLEIKGLMKLFEMHKLKLSKLYGKFPENSSFQKIIEVEYERWLNTDEVQQKSLDKLIKKNKGKLSIDEWIIAVTSWGIPADRVSQITKLPIPPNLYYEISNLQEKQAKAAEEILYDTTHLPETENLYYKDHRMMEFKGKIVDIIKNKKKNMEQNIVILDRSAVYPFSGGQLHDEGTIKIDGNTYNMENCLRIGKCVLHFLDNPLPKSRDEYIGQEVEVKINEKRRTQLRWHHSATHVIYAASRQTLGPHVWQQGAKKTPIEAHLDISHYQSLKESEEYAIEQRANELIRACIPITKTMMNKSDAELKYGFSLYQGGAIPGNELRIINIEGTDVEACCGTHCDNTGEIGFIRLLKSQRISDGIVRLTFVAGDRAYEELKVQTDIMNHLCSLWGIEQCMIQKTAERFFKDYKRLTNETKEQDKKLIDYQVKLALTNSESKLGLVISNQEDPTLYFSVLEQYAKMLQEKERGIAFLGNTFIIGIIGVQSLFDPKKLTPEFSKKKEKKVSKRDKKRGKEEDKKEEKKEEKVEEEKKTGKEKAPELKIRDKLTVTVNKKKVPVSGLYHFSYAGTFDNEIIKEFLLNSGFSLIQLIHSHSFLSLIHI